MDANIFSLITLYNPSPTVLENVREISNQVSHTFILDNSNYANEEFYKLENVTYFPNYRNLGLSVAFNKVLKTADFVDEDFILFFDQDSKISENYIEKLVQEFETKRQEYKLGAIAPVIFDCNTSKNSMSRKFNSNTEQTITILPRLITSSMLVPFHVLKEIDLWDENIFLDWADFDLTYRIRKAGYNCAITSNAVLNHHLGDNNKKVFGRNFPYYTPIREYYQVRDALRCAIKRTTPFKEKIGMFYVASLRALIHLLIFDGKIDRLKMHMKAWRDFFKHKVGVYER